MHYSSKLSPEEFRSLRSKPVSEYFTHNDSGDHAPEGFAEAIEMDANEVATFEREFAVLLSHRKGFQGLSQARQFSRWWDQQKTAYLTRPVMSGYRDSGMTMGELLDDLHLHFVVSEMRRKDESRIVRTLGKVFKNKMVLTSAFTIGVVLTKAMGFLWSLAILGPGVQMVNSYTQAVVTPLAQTAQQKGSKDLGTLASDIQSWLTRRSRVKQTKEELQKVTEKLRTTDFSRLSPEQAEARWAQFEKTYFKLFLDYNQTLPSHLRDGRNLMKDWMVFIQLGVSSNLSTFDNQYWTHSRELQSLQSRIASRGSATASEKRLIKVHKDEMAAAQERISGALAAWKVYEFMFPEFSKGDAQFKAFSRSMRFDLYAKRFAGQMDQVLRKMDADFLIQDKLAYGGGSRL